MPLVTRFSNQGNLFKEATEPNWQDGDLWSDTTAESLKINVNGTATDVGKSSFSSAAVVSYSQTIGDYTQPTAAVATTEKDNTAAVWGKDSDQTIENFTTYANTTEGDASYPTSNTSVLRVNPTTDVLDGIFTTVDASNQYQIYRDLTSISNTAWNLRFKLTISAITNPGNFNYAFFVGFSSTTTGADVAEDGIALRLSVTSGGSRTYNIVDTDNSTMFYTAVEQTFAKALTTETVYVEMIRSSATAYSIELFSDSNYTTSIEKETGTVAAGSDSYRYFKAMFADNSGHATGNMTISLDDIQMVNGATTYTQGAANAIDDDVNTFWESNAETNPAIYVDCGGANTNLLAIAVYPNANSTETEIAIRASADTTFTSSEDVRTITYSNLTNGAWNYIRYNLKNLRYLQIYGNSGASKVLAINEIKYMTKTDSQILADLGILEISGTDTSLALDGT